MATQLLLQYKLLWSAIYYNDILRFAIQYIPVETIAIQHIAIYQGLFLVWLFFHSVHFSITLLASESEESVVSEVGSILVAILLSCQNMKLLHYNCIT